MPEAQPPSATTKTIHVDVVRPEWHQLPNLAVWRAAYRMPGATAGHLPAPITLDLGDVRAALFYGSFEYLDASESTFEFGDAPMLSVQPKVTPRLAPTTAWLLLVTPHSTGPGINGEDIANRRFTMVRALLTATLGKNVAYKEFTKGLLHIAERNASATGPVIRNPFVYPVADLSAQGTDLARRTWGALARLKDDERQRVVLSLHWYDLAVADDGVDALLKAWIAIEALVMPDSQDITPVVQAMSRAYSISTEAAKEEFLIGRLYGLRGAIVHLGRVTSLNAKVPDFLHTVYEDLLLEKLGEGGIGHARTFLERNPDEIKGLVLGYLKKDAT